MLRRVAELMHRHRRRLARAALVLALIAIGSELWPQVPRDTQFEFALGPDHHDIVELHIAYVHDGSAMHGVRFSWAQGAPPRVRHALALPSGAYEAHCELRLRDGRARSVRRRFDTPAQGVLQIRLLDSELGVRSAVPRSGPRRRGGPA